MSVTAYDNTDTSITDTTLNNHWLKLFGSGWVGNEDGTTLIIGSPVINTTYDRSWNLKTWITARLTGGKVWADVAYVLLSFRLINTATGAEIRFYLDDVVGS